MTVKQLEARIAELEKQIREPKAVIASGVVHHHHHYSVQPQQISGNTWQLPRPMPYIQCEGTTGPVLAWPNNS